jgi:COP9 signalosome complex subunit 3
MAPKEFSTVCIKLAETLILCNVAIRGIPALRTAVAKISAYNPNLLTPVHTAFALVCLKAKVYDASLSVIDIPIFEVNPKENGLTALDYLSYFYYVGMLYTGLKRYQDAVQSLELTLAVDTRELSIVQVEAYKKLILINLIMTGKQYSFASSSKLGNGSIQKLKRIAAEYTKLAEAFAFGTEAIMRSVNREGAVEVYQQDKTFGLVKLAIKSHRRREIRKLTNTYVTLALTDMAARAGLDDVRSTESYVLGMIEDGEIFAKIDQKGGMLSFEEDPEQYDSKEMAQRLGAKIQEMFALSQKLKEVHNKIAVDANYVRRTMPKSIEEEAETDPNLRRALEA